MHKRLLAAIGLVLALAPVGAQRRVPPPRPAPAPPPRVEPLVPFRVGETLSYDISWSSFISATAATATVGVREKRPAYGSLAYYIAAEGRPTSLVAAFYSLYYKVDAWIDAFALLPLRASVYSQERGRSQNKVTLFDQAHSTARFETQPDGTTRKDLRLPPQTLDPLSAIFALRAGPMKAGMRRAMPITYNGAVYQVQVTIDGRESLRTPLGTQSAWRITPVVMQNGHPAASPRGLTLWISDDGRRLPLKMQVELPVGKFVLTLTSAR